jgi:TonB family protein
LNVIHLADRPEVARRPALADFKPKVGGDEPTRAKRFRMSRSVVVIIVVGAHVVAGALFAIPVIKRAIFEPAPAQLSGPPVAMVDMAMSPTEDLAPASKTRFPVLKQGKTDNPTHRARSAGITLAEPARTVLLVRVSAEGRSGEVAIIDGSGNAVLDQVAIEYARAQEWTPALVAGRESAMSIRLAVDFDPGS